MKPIIIVEASHGCLMRIGEYEPGNGTSYKAIAVKFPFNSSFNVMGRVSDGWLVVNCNTTRSHLFQKEGLLVDAYIQEKLGGGPGDFPHFGDLVRKLVYREFPVKTKENIK